MDSLMNTFLASEFLVSWIFGNNLKVTLIWFIIVYSYAVIWQLIRYFMYHSIINEYQIERSHHFPEFATFTSTSISIENINIKTIDSLEKVDDAVNLLRRNFLTI